jgi:hypothetical protein
MPSLPETHAARRALEFMRPPGDHAAPTPDSTTPADGAPLPVYIQKGARDYAQTEWLLSLVHITIALAALIAGVLFFANLTAARKDTVRINAPDTLSVLADKYFQVEGLRFDQIATSVITILTLKHHVDEGGAPYFELLQGMVAPKIYMRAESGLKKAIIEIKKTMIIQNLNITSIDDLETDPNTRRVSCYVRGYFSTTSRLDGQTRVVPYRGLALLELNTVGSLNPLPFTMLDLEEKVGPAAVDWDATRKKETANAH